MGDRAGMLGTITQITIVATRRTGLGVAAEIRAADGTMTAEIRAADGTMTAAGVADRGRGRVGSGASGAEAGEGRGGWGEGEETGLEIRNENHAASFRQEGEHLTWRCTHKRGN